MIERFERARAVEVELLGSAARRDPVRVDAMLHPDFFEIGRSGRRWSRHDLMAELGAEAARPTPRTDEWEYVDLAPGLVLVTYRIQGTGGGSRHASIWDLSGDAPRIRFHQGTPTR